MKIAVEGCAHGELEIIYDTIKCLEEKEGIKIDLLICCGDFQSSRNEEDLRCMAVPPKYYNICSFYKYYNGERVAPILTIFVGGNHEASNYLQELPYGGWVAPNIYYLGYANVINIAGIRIGGISGIYKSQDYMKGHFERSPYDDGSKRSVYHIRNLEVFRLKQMSESLNIFLSHDWPTNVCEYGDKEQLMRFKPHFIQDIESGQLGSKPGEELLKALKPNFWFAAHLHCKFAALIPHDCGKYTKFLALDKCLPRRRFLQIIDIPHDQNSKLEINYDLEWLTILRTTNHLLSVKTVLNFLPGPNGTERWNFKPTNEEMDVTLKKLDGNLKVPNNFEKTAIGYRAGNHLNRNIKQPPAVCNPQTVLLCQILGIDDPLNLILNFDLNTSKSINSPEISLYVDSINERGTLFQRSSLKLPEPTSDSLEYDDSELEMMTEECEKESGHKNERITEKDEEEINSFVDDKLMEGQSVKRFKRRNAEFYQKSFN